MCSAQMIEQLDTPLKYARGRVYLGVGIFSWAHLAVRRTSLLSAGFLPVEIQACDLNAGKYG